MDRILGRANKGRVRCINDVPQRVSQLRKVVPDNLQRLDRVFVWLAVFDREYCEHTRLVQH